MHSRTILDGGSYEFRRSSRPVADARSCDGRHARPRSSANCESAILSAWQVRRRKSSACPPHRSDRSAFAGALRYRSQPAARDRRRTLAIDVGHELSRWRAGCLSPCAAIRLCGAAWAQRQPGNTAVLWPPQLIPGERSRTAHPLAASRRAMAGRRGDRNGASTVAEPRRTRRGHARSRRLPPSCGAAVFDVRSRTISNRAAVATRPANSSLTKRRSARGWRS